MKLDNHIALKFLSDENFSLGIVDRMYPDAKNAVRAGDDDPPQMQAAANLYILLSPNEQRAYYITESVLSKLDMIKLTKKTEYIMASGEIAKNKFEASIIDEADVKRTMSYDWSVFERMPHRKITLILPDNQLYRIMFSPKFLSFAHLCMEAVPGRDNQRRIMWSLGFVSREQTPRVSKNWMDKQIQDIEGTMYRLLCFLFMTANEEIIVQPGGKHGTRKSGKVVNTLPLPVTVVNNNWNITSIRTEGFPVSGHLRVQPTKDGPKLIFIEPFKKHGYVRRAKSEGKK